MLRRFSSIAALLAAVLVGCGQGQGPAPAPTAAPTAGTAATAAPDPSASASAGATASAASADAGASGDASAAPASPAPAGMIEIPAGVFVMGAAAAYGLPEERPQHEVAIARFHLDETEVATLAYKKCVAEGKCKPTHKTSFCNEPHSDRDDHPINCVDWNMADAYCAAVGSACPASESGSTRRAAAPSSARSPGEKSRRAPRMPVTSTASPAP